ncbi:F-box/kelch-repeat protein [Cardamine amara subsp. amara]|uniref:F-box/kelch-repeat protein n=1 Tax=Cardamine amara subsp. amara TaxID=228776 RepID=A0ABD1BSP0_CARAN
MTRMCDLPPELLEMIFTKIPITSIRTVRSTCRLWKALTKDWVLGKGATREQFLGFMTMDYKVCSLRFHLCRKNKGKEDEDLLDLSIKQVDLLNQVDISKVYHCEGLVLCVAKDNSRLMVWNPYLGQTRWIVPITDFNRYDTYALGYDINHNHKIFRFTNDINQKKFISQYEIYDFSSNSWRVLKVTPDWTIDYYQRSVSLKGSSYFFAPNKIIPAFLLCFDFTRERFGPRLPLPFRSNKYGEIVTLSCVKEEQLAVLYQENEDISDILNIWITTKIEPKTLSWSKFLRVELRPFALTGVQFGNAAGSFLVDEQEKVVVLFDLEGEITIKATRYHKALIIGSDGYFKSVCLGEAAKVGEPCPITGSNPIIYCPSLVCSSSYFPSMVQLNQPRKRKERDD